mgnify:CR=1 FL=1
MEQAKAFISMTIDPKNQREDTERVVHALFEKIRMLLGALAIIHERAFVSKNGEIYIDIDGEEDLPSLSEFIQDVIEPLIASQKEVREAVNKAQKGN